jgi:hypothetical protein
MGRSRIARPIPKTIDTRRFAWKGGCLRPGVDLWEPLGREFRISGARVGHCFAIAARAYDGTPIRLRILTRDGREETWPLDALQQLPRVPRRRREIARDALALASFGLFVTVAMVAL